MKIEKNITLLKGQYDFLKSDAKYRLISGGIGCGKTTVCNYEAFIHAMTYPGITGIIARKNLTTLRRTTMKNFFSEILDDKSMDLVSEYSRSQNYLKFKNNSIIYFMDLENIGKIHGIEAGFIYVDEAAEITEDIFYSLIGRLRQKNTPRKMWLSTNPSTPFHWLFKMFYLRKSEGFFCINTTTSENTFLPTDYIDTLNATYKGINAKRYLDGLWLQDDGLVYNEFIQSKHLYSISTNNKKNFARYIGGVDWGYINPSVFILIGVTKDESYYVIDEIYKTRTLTSDFISLIKEKIKEKHLDAIYCDPSNPEGINLLKACGFNACKAANSINNGIQSVKSLLTDTDADASPRLKISDKCTSLIREFSLYTFSKNKDEPLKENDHCLDALRYALESFLKQKSRIITGDKITFERRILA
jgi:PBSX family phage terminase large subunit